MAAEVGTGQTAPVERDLATGVAHRRPQVVAVHLQELVGCDAAQPEEQRHGGLPEVVPQVPRRLQVDFLEHVGGVDSPPQPGIEPEGHHPAQPSLVPRQQRPQLAVAGGRAPSSRLVSLESPVCAGSWG